MSGPLRVGACQTPEFLGDIDTALGCVEDFARRADAHGVALLLFPECFLQGYLIEPSHLRDHALDLGSAEMWLVSADVTGERVSYGPTSVMNPQAEVVAQVPLMTTGMAIADIQ